jgi:magnesium-transporting ATPase (P-type)
VTTVGKENPEKKAVGASWHSQEVQAVIDHLKTSAEGLTSEEARQRLEKYGPNQLPREAPERLVIRFLRQFNDVLIYVLMSAAVITAFLGEWIDTGVILAVVMINAIIGFVQEGKAEAAMESIRKMLSLNAMVQRDGKRSTIDADQLVPGDVVHLESGDRVPADVRIISARNLRIEEAALTGESEPANKQKRSRCHQCRAG